MWLKGVLLLVVIVCWTAVCNGEGEFKFFNEIGDILSEELARENLILFENDNDAGTTTSDTTKTTITVHEDACDPNPCENEGKCSKENDNFKCNCEGNFIGEKCQTNVCDPNPCQNGGTCVKENDKFKCKCAGDFIGEKCQTKCDCGPNGNCTHENGTKTCECIPGFQEKNGRCTETCEDDDCQHSTECIPFGEHNFCNCTIGLSGDKCDIVDECINGTLKNCKNENGSCTYDESKEKAVCTCPEKKALDSVLNFCLECDCGENGECSVKNGEKTCNCKEKFALKDEKCEECNCGTKGTCSFVNGEKNCDCSKGYILDDGICKECDCGKNGKCYFKNDVKVCNCTPTFVFKEKDGKCHKCDCGIGGICEFEEDKAVCSCKKGFTNFNNTCKECDCGENGDCTIENNGKKKCKCDSGYAVKKEGNKETCVEICENADDCSNEGTCENSKEEGKKVCFCQSGFEGDKCELITDCLTGKFSECEKSGGECKFVNSKLTCVCKPTKTLDESLNKPICKEKCNNDCQNGGTCDATTKLCKCKKNTSGEKCELIDGCDPLNCANIAADCTYDKQRETATCKCKDNNYYYENGKCNPEWCRTGCDLEVSKCEYNDGVGTCICKTAGSYYNYASNACIKIDPCFNITCEGNLVCKNGNCDCPDKHTRNGTECKPMDLCTNRGICFPEAKCETGSSSEYVKCTCDSSSKFYLPKSGKCSDGRCFLPDERINCTRPCPPQMNFKDGACKYEKEERNCNKDCGFLGWCSKVSDTENCVCTPNYAELHPTTKKCILKASAVCPTNELVGDGKCKCTGKYKQAENGITCELKSCSDEDVKNECKNKGASICIDNWKNDKGYKCKCPDGYIDDAKKGCIAPCSNDKAKDECSSNGQLCFIGDRDTDGDCRCQPTFTYNENKKSCELDGDNTFMIHSLPVMKNKYETPGNNINKAVLNRDVSTSMKQAFSNLDFVHVYEFKAEGDTLLCDVWLQFKSSLPSKFNASLEVKRWKSLTLKGENELLLPPNLLLSSSLIDGVSEEELTLCSDSVRQSVCGTGSTCDSDKCSCVPGYRQIDSTIKSSDKKRIVRCEDIDECTENTHDCKDNSECVNTLGDYFCKCKPGFKKKEGDAFAMDKKECTGLCSPNPCIKGTCQLTKENNPDCTCQPGYSGSFCNRADANLIKSAKATKVVGAVLGTLLAIVIILIIVYVVRQRKNSYSEDFTPAPRVDNAEMAERRPMRGVTNRAYQ